MAQLDLTPVSPVAGLTPSGGMGLTPTNTNLTPHITPSFSMQTITSPSQHQSSPMIPNSFSMNNMNLASTNNSPFPDFSGLNGGTTAAADNQFLNNNGISSKQISSPLNNAAVADPFAGLL